MNIEDMHYDFRAKMNMVDEDNYFEFAIPEVDWLLNEAYEYLVRRVLFGTKSAPLVDATQRVLDDFSPVIVEKVYTDVDNALEIPNDYMYFVRGRAEVKVAGCDNIYRCIVIPRNHTRTSDISVLDVSSPKWGEINLYSRDGFFIFDDKKDWELKTLKLSYIKMHPYMHYAEGTESGSYELPDGTVLTGKRDCILKREVCRDIVDIAVLLGTQGLRSMPDINIKLQKLNQKTI